jgi:hypothetical protein
MQELPSYITMMIWETRFSSFGVLAFIVTNQNNKFHTASPSMAFSERSNYEFKLRTAGVL